MSYEIVPPDGDRFAKSGGPRPGADGPGGSVPITEVGSFAQGNEASQWVLRRYLLTRAIGASVVRTVHWFGVAILVVAVLVWLAGITWLAVLIGLVAIVVLLIRVALSGIQRRLSGAAALGPDAARVDRLVGQTRKGMRTELRRIGLPSAPWGPALIGLRLLRPIRRMETVRKLGRFDLGKVVSQSTLDELHLLLAKRTGLSR